MAYFRKLDAQLEALQFQLDRDTEWLILINADPDAIASALALRRLIRHKVRSVTLARVNVITRPDNLTMIRALHIPLIAWRPSMARKFNRFAIVDSQPHHHPAFAGVKFSLIIDHHPVSENPAEAPFQDIRPEYGATSTMMTEYLYNAHIRPGRHLATALQYGIRTDTNTFGRDSSEIDLRAYHHLSRFADATMLTRIIRSEYLPEWLPYFSQAFENLRACGKGHYTWLGEVKSADLLVVVADFFLRVHGLRWVAVCGLSEKKLVVVFRGGLGAEDLGQLAERAFGNVGSAGGHRSMARAEIPTAAMPGENADAFAFERIHAVFPARK